VSETPQYSPAPSSGLEGKKRDMWFGTWLLGKLRSLVWGSEHQAQSSQADGAARRSQNLTDALKDEAL